MYAVVMAIQLVGIVILMAEIVYLFTRNESRLQIILLMMSVCVFVNFLGETGEMLSQDAESALMCVRFSYLGKPFLVFFCLLFFLDYCRVKMPKWLMYLLFVIQLSVVVMAFTCPYHTLYYTSVGWTTNGVFPHLVLGKSAFYWVYSAFIGLYLLSFAILVIRQFKRSKTDVERSQTMSLLAIVIIMAVSLLVYLTGVTGGYDTTLLGYVLMLIILVHAILRYNLFETLTLARDRALQDSDDGLVVLDQRSNIIFVNSTAAAVLDSLFEDYEPSGVQALKERAYNEQERLHKEHLERAPKTSVVNAMANMESNPSTYKPMYDHDKLSHVYDDQWTALVVAKLSELSDEDAPLPVGQRYYRSRKRELEQDGTFYGCIFELKDITESYTYSTRLEHDVEEKTQEIRKMQRDITISFANMVEARDDVTGAHIKNTSNYVRIITQSLQEMIAEECCNDPMLVIEKWGSSYANALEPDFLETLEDAAPLHDLGKIYVPDAILRKPGKLTEEEFEAMKTHASRGAEIIEATLKGIETDRYVAMAKNVAGGHHEKWNGKGYPLGLAGESIPLSARIMAIADVYDALRSPRSYKEAFTPATARAIIEEDAGKHFDPVLVEAFTRAIDQIEAV